MSDDYILQTEKLIGGYGKLEIVHGIDMHLKRNEIVSIIGPNGSGKSTLIKIIYGIATYHSGTVTYNSNRHGNLDISNLDGNKLVNLGIAYVPQLENIFPNMTILENLEMGGYTLEQHQVGEAIEKVFYQYPVLGDRKHAKAKVLSGGQRQMLAIGRALMIEPELIILDEPSAALQPSLVIEIMELIEDMRDNSKVSVLMVEQNTKSALRISDRGYLLAAGQIVHVDDAKELLYNTDLGAYYLGKK